jgi:aryl-alcohol dehydrogenase-like predicted oxidoreductase
VSKITRRLFLEKAIAGASVLASQPLWAETRRILTATDRVRLGQTGIEVSKIAMGTGFKGWERASNQTRLGHEGFTRLMLHGFENGLNFFDMADLYGSHPFMKPVLKETSRDKVVLLSKVWFAEAPGLEATDRAIPSFDRFRRELGTEMIDIVLIHCVSDSRWPSQLARMRDELDLLKQKGDIRATGCSCHDLGALQVAARDPWVDVIFARINNTGARMDHKDPNAVAAVLREARSNGKAVVGMKIYGAGDLTEKEQRDQSLRYVWGNGLVDAMTIGFENKAQVGDTINHLNDVLKVRAT